MTFCTMIMLNISIEFDDSCKMIWFRNWMVILVDNRMQLALLLQFIQSLIACSCSDSSLESKFLPPLSTSISIPRIATMWFESFMHLCRFSIVFIGVCNCIRIPLSQCLFCLYDTRFGICVSSTVKYDILFVLLLKKLALFHYIR